MTTSSSETIGEMELKVQAEAYAEAELESIPHERRSANYDRNHASLREQFVTAYMACMADYYEIIPDQSAQNKDPPHLKI